MSLIFGSRRVRIEREDRSGEEKREPTKSPTRSNLPLPLTAPHIAPRLSAPAVRTTVDTPLLSDQASTAMVE